MKVSGKLVILGIVTVALASAGANWWFRYSATSRSAKFWGPQTVRLIRDAPTVELYEYGRDPNAEYQRLINGRDISHAPGLLHLRNALLDDQSFMWPAQDCRPGSWGWAIVFRDEPADDAIVLRFVSDWSHVDRPDHQYMLSCEPIAAGLRRFIDELPASPPAPRR